VKYVAVGVAVFLVVLAARTWLLDRDAEPGVSVEGIVLELEGNLAAVEYFVVMDSGGERYIFVPADDLTFHGGPVSHLRDHITSGDPVFVAYETAADGSLVAVEVSDA
jgi:hypothetical protein